MQPGATFAANVPFAFDQCILEHGARWERASGRGDLPKPGGMDATGRQR